MAYLLDKEIDLEIQSAFSSDPSVHSEGDESLKKLFKTHKKLTIKFLNRKWDISSLKSHIDHKIIPRGLRERIIPAGHLHTPRFLKLWKESCLERGLDTLRMIVNEEELQLEEIRIEIDNSVKLLEPFKSDPNFDKSNDLLKKEVERTQKYLKASKQEKFKQNLADWEREDIFDPTVPRGRSRSRKGRGHRSKTPQPTNYSSDSDLDSQEKSVIFLEKGGATAEKIGTKKGINKPILKGRTGTKNHDQDHASGRDSDRPMRELRSRRH